jgi:ubiquinone/menaquinone biosynthesis C-methylase UbiE
MKTENEIEEFYDKIATKYDDFHHPSRPGVLIERRIVIKRISRILEGKSLVLDLGGGTSCWTEGLFRDCSCICNLDISRNMLKLSKMKLNKRLGNGRLMDFLKADMELLPIRENTVGFVMCMYSLGHIKKRREALLEIHRVLKKHGHGVIAVDGPWFNLSRPIARSKLHDLFNTFFSKGYDKTNYETHRDRVFRIYVHHYSFPELESEIRLAHLDVLETFGCLIPFSFVPYVVLKKLKKYSKLFENGAVQRLDTLLAKSAILTNFSPHIFCIAQKKS